MASDQPSSTDSEGTILRQKTPDWNPGPVYVDWEDVLEALEEIRQRNVHGYGYVETIAKAADGDEDSGDTSPGDSSGGSGDASSGDASSGGSGDSSGDAGSGDAGSSDASADSDSETDTNDDPDHPWLNQPFSDPTTGQPLGAGPGILLPFTLAWDGGLKMFGRDQTAPRRTHAVAATFNAFAFALAAGRQEAGGGAMPALKNGRLAREHYRRWLAYDDDVPAEGAVSALILGNAGVWINADYVRRGDVLQVVWKGGGTHALYCWDVHSNGQSLFLQVVSAQPSTAGLGVPLAPESLTTLGKPEAVRRKGGTEQHPVWHPSDGGSAWLTSPDARDFYRLHGFWFNKDGEGGARGLSIQDVYVGRFHRVFPRFPLALGGSNLVSSSNPDPMPADAPDDGHVSVPPARLRDSSVDLYYSNNEGPGGVPRQGGFFPVSASRSWHGGVHLYPEGPDEVTAPIDGVVVAARLTTADNGCSVGDTGFVLIKTKLKIAGNDVEFFTLLAHLDAPEAGARAIPWLDEIFSVPSDDDPRWTAMLDQSKQWYSVLPVPAGGDDRDGADSPDGSLIVYGNRDRSQAPLPGTIPTGAIVAVEVRQDEHGWAKVCSQDGSAEGWVYATGRLDPIDITNLDAKRKDKRTSLLAGEVVDLSDLDRPLVVRVGEIVGHAGQVGGDHAVHFEIFSKDLIQAYDKTAVDIEDTDHSLYTDRAKFEQAFFDKFDQTDEGGQGKDTSVQHFMINQSTRPEDDLVLAQEICQFFAQSPLRDRMHTLITRHHSEWGDSIDWSSLDSSDQWAHISDEAKQSFKDDLGKLQWWKGSFLADQGLPDDQIVYHYHPITFLAWLDEKREADDTGEMHASIFELNHGGPVPTGGAAPVDDSTQQTAAAPPDDAPADDAPQEEQSQSADAPADASADPGDAGSDAATTQFQITILDDVGQGVGSVDIVFKQGDATSTATTGDDGVATWQAPSADAVTANFASLDALRTTLADRWSTPRDRQVPDDATTLELTLALTAADDVALTGGSTDSKLYVVPPAKDLLGCICIPGGTFDFDSSFLRPDVADHLKKLDDVVQAHSDAKLFVVAHTDRVGPEQYNKSLADRRALSTYAFLTGDTASWERLYLYEHWGLKVLQTVLQDQGHDPGNTDGVMTDQTQSAMRDFTGSTDTVANDATFRAQLFAAYMSAKHANALTASQFLSTPYVGCGEFNPIAAPNADELANQAPGNEKNRRVIVYAFSPDKAPSPPPCALVDIGPCKTQMQTPGKVFKCAFYDKIATQCDCETADPPAPQPDPTPPSTDKGQLDVRVLMNGDPKTPFDGATVTVFNATTGAAVAKLTTSNQGWAAGTKLAGGRYTVVADSLNKEWGTGTGHADVPAGKTRGIMIALTRTPPPPPANPNAFGTLVVKTVDTAGQPAFFIKVAVGPTPLSKANGIIDPTAGDDASASITLSPGDYFVSAFRFSRDVKQVTITADQTTTVTLVGNALPPSGEQINPYDIDWNFLCQSAFDDCDNVYQAMKIINSTWGGPNPTPLNVIPGLIFGPFTPTGIPAPGVYFPPCVTKTVSDWVVQLDAEHPGFSPRIGQVPSQTKLWCAQNKAKIDAS